jgi:hypothetical protein
VLDLAEGESGLMSARLALTFCAFLGGLYQQFMHHFAPVPIEKMLVSSGAPLFACRAAVFEEDKRLIR